MTRPEVVVFDVNGTLSDLSGFAPRFTEAGAPPGAAEVWLAAVLRDGMALAAAGTGVPFSTVASECLRAVLFTEGQGGAPDPVVDGVVEGLVAGFSELDLHEDVVPGVERLAQAGLRLVTLSNGSAAVAEQLIGRVGIGDRFEACLSVDEPGVWKPAAKAYRYAADVCGVEPGAMTMVAVHPWDVDGAARAGMGTAWVNRRGAPYPGYFSAPDRIVGAIGDLAAHLV